MAADSALRTTLATSFSVTPAIIPTCSSAAAPAAPASAALTTAWADITLDMGNIRHLSTNLADRRRLLEPLLFFLLVAPD